jgi:hypothetical protein
VSAQRQITLKQNPNPNEGVVAANKVPCVVQDPLDTPLLGSNMIQGPNTKKWRRSAWTDFRRQLARTISVDFERILA